MKKAIFLLSIISVSFFAQAQSKAIFISPSYKQTYHQGDTVSATVQIFDTDGVGLISWTIAPGSSPATLGIPVTTSTPATGATTSTVTVINAIAGTYLLKATGTSPTGSTAFITDSLVVLPPVPPCPPAKVPVQIVTTLVYINGAWINKSTVVTFSDGTSQ